MLASDGNDVKVKITNLMTNGSQDTNEVPGRPLNTLDLAERMMKILVKDALEFFEPRVKIWNWTNSSP